MVEFLVLTFGADKGLGYYGLWAMGVKGICGYVSVFKLSWYGNTFLGLIFG